MTSATSTQGRAKTGPVRAPRPASTGCPACTACTAPTPDGGLCRPCTTTLTAHLADVPFLTDQLAVAASRQTRYGAPAGRSRTAETPLPVDLTAASLYADLTVAVTRSVVHLHPAGSLPAGVTGKTVWLTGRLPALRVHPEAARLLGDLHRLTRAAWKAIDRPVELIPLGECGTPTQHPAAPCACTCHVGGTGCDLPAGCGCDNGWRPTITTPCPRRLYAEPGDTVVHCRTCGTGHDVRARRDQALTDAEHIHGRPPFLAAVMTAAGLPCTPSMIRNYAARRTAGLTPTYTEHTPAGPVHWYRLGDIRAAWHHAHDTTTSAATDPVTPPGD